LIALVVSLLESLACCSRDQEILDYFVLPPARLPGVSLSRGAQSPANINNRSHPTLDEVIEAIMRFKVFKARPTGNRKNRGPRRKRKLLA
jgi:hypothetical protein